MYARPLRPVRSRAKRPQIPSPPRISHWSITATASRPTRRRPISGDVDALDAALGLSEPCDDHFARSWAVRRAPSRDGGMLVPLAIWPARPGTTIPPRRARFRKRAISRRPVKIQPGRPAKGPAGQHVEVQAHHFLPGVAAAVPPDSRRLNPSFAVNCPHGDEQMAHHRGVGSTTSLTHDSPLRNHDQMPGSLSFKRQAVLVFVQ